MELFLKHSINRNIRERGGDTFFKIYCGSMYMFSSPGNTEWNNDNKV